MSKRRVGTLLIGLAMLGLLPFLPHVWAYATAQIDLPSSNLATYKIGGTGESLISCGVPTRITVDGKQSSASGPFVECINNYGGLVTLNWSMVSPTTAGFSATGDSGAMGTNDTSTCRQITINYGSISNNSTRDVVIKGTTDSAAGFYVEVEFTATLFARNNVNPSGGCP